MDDHEPNMLKNFIFYLLKLNNHIYLQFNHLLNCSSECTQIEAYIVSFLPHAKNCVKICGLFQHEYQLFERGALSQFLKESQVQMRKTEHTAQHSTETKEELGWKGNCA